MTGRRTASSQPGIEYAVSGDGTRIGFECLGAGLPLVAVHGSTADRSRWAPVATRLAERFSIVLMDRRGRGLSDDRPEYALAREVDDVLAVVEATGRGSTLLGHSYGALCALEAAARTDRIDGLLLYEPPFATAGHQVIDGPTVERIEQRLRRGDRETALVTFLVEVVGVDEPTLALMRQAPAWQARLAAAHTYTRELRTAQNYVLDAAALATLTIPVRFLLGTASAPFLRAATMAAHAAIGHSDVVELPGHGHTAMDTAPELFADSVIGFATQPAAAAGARASGIERT